MAGDADGIAHVQELEKFEAAFANSVQADIDLYTRAFALDMGKAGFAMQAQSENSSGDADVYAIGFELSGGAAAIFRYGCGGRQRPVKLVRIGREPQGDNLFQFFLALKILFNRLKRQRGILSAGDKLCADNSYGCNDLLNGNRAEV